MLREKFPEFCSSPSPPIEGREWGRSSRQILRGIFPWNSSSSSGWMGREKLQGEWGRDLGNGIPSQSTPKTRGWGFFGGEASPGPVIPQ